MEDDQGIIIPKRNRRDPRIGPDSLMILLPSEVKFLVAATKAQKIALNDAAITRIYVAEPGTREPINICGPFLGAPQAVMAFEKLIALGAERVWMLGWCGSIDCNIKIGDIVLPTSAFVDEGTSRHYPIGNDRPSTDENLCQALRSALEKRGAIPATGAVWSTDAPYRETQEKVAKFQSAGALAVDMELSALATVAIYRSIQFAALLVVSDELFDYVWRPGFNHPRLKEQTRLASKVLLDVAVNFSRR